jgi:pimeloyl-ACP methyl ester carboxylesterase
MSVFTSLLAAAAATGLLAVQDGVIEEAAPASPSLRQVDPDLTPLICPFRGAIEYEPGAVECGLITVPENRERPDSRLIHLHYVRIAAWGEDETTHRDDPIIYLTGGPGVGVDSYVGRLKDHDVAEHRDLYILEQRGIGSSTDFCEQYDNVAPSLTTATSMGEMQIAGAERMRMCFREAAAQGIDLTGYNTVENARDVRALREALGFEDWNVWGISYGSHLGQMVLREDPDGVRAIVIDAIVPNDLNGLQDYGRIFSRVVSNFAETCEDGPLCEGLEERLWAAMESLRDDPVILQVDESEAFPSGEQWIPPAVAAYFPFSMAYEQEEHPAVPAVINAVAEFAETRDPKIIAGMEALLASPGDGGGGLSLSQGMSSAIRCNDGYVHEGLDAYDETPPGRWDGYLGTREGQAYMAAVCEEEGLAPRDRADYALVQTDVPTLIVNGAWDPVTPPWLAEYIHEGMPGSRLIITPYAGHGPTRSMPDCAGPVMNAFFDDPDLDALDASCLEEGEPRPVFADLKPTRAPFLAAALVADAPQSFSGPILWLGGSLLALLIGALMIPFGFLGRVIDGTSAGALNADTGGARLTAWFAALAGLAGAAMIGAGAYAATEISEVAILAGFAAPAGAGMWLVLVSGVLGVASLGLLLRTLLGGESIRIGTLLGFAVMGIAAAALSAFAFSWDLAPF